MLNIFSKQNTRKEIENKNMLNRELFNSATKKQVITKAAKQSAEDQRKLLENYKRILESNPHYSA
jgi:hypothetical protein